jgi:CheY-like chemotaxis protein
MPGKHVLIAEDERPLAHALELKLTGQGYEVTVAKNGQECLDLVTSNQYDVLLLDLMMPVSQQEDEAKALSLGASKFFIKSNTPLAVIIEQVKAIGG